MLLDAVLPETTIEEPIRAYSKSPWTEANTAYLTEQWKAGASARDIGDHIGMTRMAVIGRAHRLGLKRNVDYTFWTPGQIEQLTSLWNQSCSASQIAAQLAREFDGKKVCKSTVLHKARRLGLSRRVRSVESYKRDTKRVRKVVPFATIIDTDIPLEQRRTFEQLERGECKWPVGDLATSEGFFCGGAAFETGPYCSAHHHRAYGYTPTPGKKFSGFRF